MNYLKEMPIGVMRAFETALKQFGHLKDAPQRAFNKVVRMFNLKPWDVEDLVDKLKKMGYNVNPIFAGEEQMTRIKRLKFLVEELRDLVEKALPGVDLHEPTSSEVAHEQHRIRTMSKKALQARVRKITDAQKMFAFARELEKEADRDPEYADIADEAWRALDIMGWNREGKWTGRKGFGAFKIWSF